MTDGSLKPGRTVLVEGDRIVAVEPTAELNVPSHAETVEGEGGYLIPGLWDMHVHLFNNSSREGTNNKDVYFPLLIANGVTGVRNMWTDPDDLKTVRRWRGEMEAGESCLAPASPPAAASWTACQPACPICSASPRLKRHVRPCGGSKRRARASSRYTGVFHRKPMMPSRMRRPRAGFRSPGTSRAP